MVGKERREFFISKDLICAASGFIRNASIEGTEPIQLENIDPDIFTIFLAWITKINIENAEELIEIKIHTDEHPVTNDECKESICQRKRQLINCFALGESLESSNFRNSIMDNLIFLDQRFVTAFNRRLVGESRDIQDIYRNTRADSLLRKFLLNTIITSVDMDSFIGTFPGGSRKVSLPPDFIKDLVHENRAMCQRFEESLETYVLEPLLIEQVCRYHEHPDKPEGYCCDDSEMTEDEDDTLNGSNS